MDKLTLSERLAYLADHIDETDDASKPCVLELLREAQAAIEGAVKALRDMRTEYISLKRLSLMMARSDAPGWMPGLNENDDIHVIASRKALDKLTNAI